MPSIAQGTSESPVTTQSNSQRVLNRAGNISSERLHHFIRLRFHHHSRQRFRARVANNHAPVAIEIAFRSFNRTLDFGHFNKRNLFANPNILNDLRKDLKIADQIRERLAAARYDFHHSQGGEQAIAGGGLAVTENDMS